MTKDELTTVLGIAGVDPKTIDAMTQSYEMGFEHGAKVGVHMRTAIEAARDVCKYLDHDLLEEAKDHTALYWDAIERLRAFE